MPSATIPWTPPNMARTLVEGEHPPMQPNRPLPMSRPLPMGAAHAPQQPGIECTRAPPKGWRPIQGEDPFWRTDNLDPALADRWAEDDRPFLLVQVMGCGANEPTAEDHGRKIEEVANKYLRLKPPQRTEFQYARPHVKPVAKNRAPFYHRLILPSEEAKQKLDEAKIISTREITIQFEQFRHELPTHQATYLKPHYFGVPFSSTDEEMETIIRRKVQDKISEEPTKTAIKACIQLDIQTVAHSRWRHTTPDQAFDIIHDSVQAYVTKKPLAGGGHESLVAVYCEAPATDAGRWLYFRDLFRRIPFGDDVIGRPVLYTKEQHCAICHSTDHDIGTCYLPGLKDWNGPRPQEKGNANRGGSAPRGGGTRGNGHRGGARGRGGHWQGR